MAAEDEECGVVFLAVEFQRRGVVEGVDGVLFGEFEGQRPFEGVQVREGQLDDFGARAAAEEEGRFGVFVGLGRFFVEGALGAGVAGFAGGGWLVWAQGNEQIVWHSQTIDLHLT